MSEATSRTLNADASVLYCEPCGNVLAEAFCSDCPEYLCLVCANVHEKQRATKHHRLLRGAAMPPSYSTTITTISDTVRFLKCLDHPGEKLKLFCDTHDTACCTVCHLGQHKQCTVLYIPEVAKNYKTGPEYIQLTGDLKKAQQLAAKTSNEIEEIIKKVVKLKTEETATLEEYRVELKKYVDKRIDGLTSELKQIHDKDVVLLNEQLIKSKKIESNIAIKQSKLEAFEETPHDLFTESKHTRNIVQQLQVDLAGITAKTEYQVFSVKKDPLMLSVLENEAGLATIELKTVRTMAQLSPGCLSRQRDLTVTSSDDRDIFMADITVVSPSRLLLTDHYNMTLMLVDSVNDGVLSEVTVPGQPYGVCLHGDGRAAVAVYDVKKIQFCHVDNNTLSLDIAIDVQGNPLSISAYDNFNLVISCKNPARVAMITMDGRVVVEAENTMAGKQVFKNPIFTIISNDGEVFVSDIGTHTIVQMDRKFRIIQTFTSPMLTTPLGIVAVSTCQLLVVDRDSYNIVILNTTNGIVSPLLGQADELRQPRAVTWCPTSKKLYVGDNVTGRAKSLSVFCKK